MRLPAILQLNWPMAATSAKVIPGSYELLYGLACSPRKQKAYAGIAPGSLPPIQVSSGGKAEAVIGGPYHLEFKHGVQGNKLTISPSGIKLKGKAGEEYVSFRWQGKPEVKIVSRGRTVSAASMAFG